MDKATRLKVALQKSGRLTDNSLDLMVRCGLKYSRGKDQLMCYGENMPLDLLFVRDDDIPDLVQQDVCDLGIVGINVIEEKRLAFQAKGVTPLFEQLMTLDYGKCRLSIAVPDGVEYKDARSLHGKRIATTYPNILGRYLRQRDVQAEIVTLSGAVEIAPRLGRADFICDLVSSGSTLAGQSLVGSGNDSGKPGRHHHDASAGVPREAGLDPSPDDAHRRRAAGQGKQIHHAARAALEACRYSQAAARQRVADHRAARRHGRQSRCARGVSRERVLGNAREPEGCGRERDPGVAGRKDAGLTSRSPTVSLSLLEWSSLSADERRAALRRPAQADTDGLHRRVSEIIKDVRARGDQALLEFTERFDGVKLTSLEVDAAEFAAAEKALNAEQRAALERAISNVRRFHEAQLSNPLRIETSPGVICERHFRPIDACRFVCSRRRRAPALRRDHAGHARKHRRLPDSHHLHAASQGRHRRSRRAVHRQAVRRRVACSRWVARRPSPRWPMAPRAFRRSTKSSAPATAWVTAAKIIAANDPDGAALDLPAGPSEVLVIADEQPAPSSSPPTCSRRPSTAPTPKPFSSQPHARSPKRPWNSWKRRCAGSAAKARCVSRSITRDLFLVDSLQTAFDLSNALRAGTFDRAGREGSRLAAQHS